MQPPPDIRLSFNQVAEIYDQVRPTYPQELFDTLFERLPAEPEVVEVGPGTGQATRDLLSRGASVWAIEIGQDMAAKLRSNLPSPRLAVTVGDFEQIDTPPSSADAVFSSSAYHWISPSSRTAKPAAILRPGGLLAVVEVIQVDSSSDQGFFHAAQPIYNRYGQSHTGPPAPTRDNVEPALLPALESDPRFGQVLVQRWDWDQRYSASDYRKLMTSFSVTQMMEPTAREGLLEEMEAFIESRFEGQVTRPLVVDLTTGVLLPD